MNLGAFSVSLAVKDIHASKSFYEKLGFEQFHGDLEQNWVIMKNGDRVIGLFQGMFESNIMTFNPGWDQDAQPVDPYEDVRTIKASLKSEGIEVVQESGEAEGPASFVVQDPDGNTILFDQHR